MWSSFSGQPLMHLWRTRVHESSARSIWLLDDAAHGQDAHASSALFSEQGISVSQNLRALVESWLHVLYIAADGAGLRLEDHRKAIEVAAMLAEIERCAGKLTTRSRLELVDAAAGKSYVGLLAAKLVFDTADRLAAVCTIERDPRRVELSRRAAEKLAAKTPIECRCADLANGDDWPEEPSIVTALHACGPASDAVIDRTIECRAKNLLLVPCCTDASVVSISRAKAKAKRMGIPPHAQIQRRFIQACVDTERTLRLESAGYQTEVVEMVGATVTPHNLLWRARRVCEPRRMASAKRALSAWKSED